jgi:pyruvate kinase
MRRNRNAKIVATPGPASSTSERIRDLFETGADVFRLDCSHRTAKGLEDRIIAEVEQSAHCRVVIDANLRVARCYSIH